MSWIELQVSLSDEDRRTVEKLLDRRGKVGKKALLLVDVKEVDQERIKVGTLIEGLRKTG